MVGGGPSGAVAALQLARTGARVILLEEGGASHDAKVCGDALIPDSLAVLSPRWGFWTGCPPRRGGPARVRIYAPSGTAGRRGGHVPLPSAETLDEILLGAAEEAGARVVSGAEGVGYEVVDGRARLETRRGGRGGEPHGAARRARDRGLGEGARPLRGIPHRSEPSAPRAPQATTAFGPTSPKTSFTSGTSGLSSPATPASSRSGTTCSTWARASSEDLAGGRPNLREVFERFRRECARAGEMLEGATALEAPSGARRSGRTCRGPRWRIASS